MTETPETGFGEALDDETIARLAAAVDDPAERAAGLHLTALDRAVERMRVAEGKLAEVRAYCLEHKGEAGFSGVQVYDILAIIDREEPRDA